MKRKVFRACKEGPEDRSSGMPFVGPPGVVLKSRAQHWAQEAKEKNIREGESSGISRRAEN